MWARVTTVQGDPDKLDFMLEDLENHVMPEVRKLRDQGYRGLYVLTDRTSGRGLTMTLWDSEESLRASEDRANAIRSGAVERTGEQLIGVERFEVTLHDGT